MFLCTPSCLYEGLLTYFVLACIVFFKTYCAVGVFFGGGGFVGGFCIVPCVPNVAMIFPWIVYILDCLFVFSNV